MMRFLLSLSAVAILFGVTSSPLMAAPGHGGHGPARVSGIHGMRQGPGGYLHNGYRGWSSHYFNARYRCNFFFCPQAGCYYYWYAPSSCYLPVSQIATYPPTVTVVNNVNVNSLAPSAVMPALPPMQ